MSQNQLESKGFFGALFDFSFTSFITLKFLRVIYALLVTLILLGGLVFLVGFLSSGEPAGVVLGLVAVPIITLFYLVIARIYLELVALFFRIGENTSVMARALAAQGGAQGPGAAAYAGPQGGSPYGPQAGSPYGGSTASPYGTTPSAHQQSPFAPPAASGTGGTGGTGGASAYGTPEPPSAQER